MNWSALLTLLRVQLLPLGVFSLPTVQPKILTSGLLQWMELAFISEPRIHRQQAAARLTPFPPHIHLNPSQTDVTVFVGLLLPGLSFSVYPITAALLADNHTLLTVARLYIKPSLNLKENRPVTESVAIPELPAYRPPPPSRMLEPTVLSSPRCPPHAEY